MNLKKILILAIVFLTGFAIYQSGFTDYLNLEYVKENLASFKDYYSQNPIKTALIFGSIYILCTALSIPGATILTLTGGALFGFLKGVIIVSFASTIGATIAFLVSRFLMKDTIQKKYGEKLKTINQGIEKDGASYLFTLRMLPVFPFFIINLLMGLTPIKTIVFYLVSQIGMLPGTAVYVNAGSQLSQIDSLKGIMSPTLLGSFVLLGLFPLIVKFAFKFFKKKEVRDV